MQARHQQPVNNQQSDRDDDLRPDFRVQKNDRSKEITDGDALQHAGNANSRELKIRKACEKNSQRENDQRAPDDLQVKIALAAAAFNATAKREWNRHANDEQEKRKDEIGGRPAMPLRMRERPIDVTPGARIVYQHHPGDRDAAKHVERNEAVTSYSLGEN